MRQRYLTGCHNRKRYIDNFELLSSNYVPDEIYTLGTHPERVIQSAYIEFMGLYPPGKGGAGKLHESLTADLGPANPPFKIRDA